MNEVLNYLRDPKLTKINKAKYTFLVSDLELFIHAVKSYFQNSSDESFTDFIVYPWINTCEELIKKYGDPRKKFALFEFVLGMWSKTDKCPENITNYTSLFIEKPAVNGHVEKNAFMEYIFKWLSENSLPTRINEYVKKIDDKELFHWDNNNLGGIFQSRKIPDYADACLVFVNIEDEKVVIETITIKDELNNIFRNMLFELPYIKDNIKESCQKQSTLVNYPFTLDEWLRQTEGRIRNDVFNLLQDSLRYYYDKEWRTSIILSAITVEMLLAEIYKTFYAKEVPEKKTLGWILGAVKDTNRIQAEIIEYLENTNEVRIKAVHRTSHILHEENAITAFCGIGSLLTYVINEYSEL